MIELSSKLRSAAAGLIAMAACGVSFRAEAQQGDFYQGKTLTIIVGLNSGGTVDTFVRSFVPFLAKHVPGKPTIIVNNMPGAGGLVATNYLMEKAQRDGLSVIYHLWDPLAQALGHQGLRARYEQFEFLGGTSDTRVNYARVDSIPGGLKKPADIAKAETLAIGALNNTDLSGLLPKMSMEVLGVKYKYITGYRGGNDIFLALQRGEVHMHNTSIGTLRTRGAQFLKSGEGMAISYLVVADKNGNFTPNKYITDIPAFPELYKQVHGKPPSGAQWDALNWLVQQVSDLMYAGLAPPGTPPAALAALRKGFDGAINDAEFIDLSVKTNGLPYAFVPVDKGNAVFKALASVSPDVLATIKTAIGDASK